MTPTTLLDQPLERTLHAWVRRFSQPQWRGRHVQAWLFEGQAERRQAERQLAALGVHARFHSAYKPLVQHFIDTVDCRQLTAVHVRYPTPATAPAQRFLLEAYPLAALLPGAAVQLQPQPEGGGALPWYDVELHLHGGQRLRQQVWAPNRVHQDTTGAPTLSPTGWLRAGTQPGGADLLDCAVRTDYEQAYALALQAVRSHPWPRQEPYFERLTLRIDLPGYEQPIAWAGETLSTLEALHEDLYFSLLEFFQQHSGRPLGDRRLQPGQIVPDVRATSVTPHVRVTLQPFDAPPHEAPAAPLQALDLLDAPPAAERIAATLHAWPAERFTARSRQGRTVWGQYHPGTQAPVFISAGQHANETSGVVGALRAAQALRQQPGAHFALIALENPDGYALHHTLCAQHPGHMHHAARYTALGDDVEYRDRAPLYEREARQQALALSGARLHVNLHGYPAHEWTRPLSGYVPRGFEPWMLPKGFFLILRHHAGWQQPARALLQAVCRQLLQVPGLAQFNARQRQLYERHAGPLPFEVIDGIACTQAQTTHDAPVTLITEFPDETVSGDAFRFAHTVQMHAALAAAQAWQGIVAGWENSSPISR